MWKSNLSAVLIACAALAHNAALARTSVPVIDHDNIEFSVAGNTLNAAQVRERILAAAAQRNWSVRTVNDGLLEATLQVRGKHTIAVDVPYAANRFSLKFKSSINMNQGSQDGKTVIHPNYNKWVTDLKQAIQMELQKP